MKGTTRMEPYLTKIFKQAKRAEPMKESYGSFTLTWHPMDIMKTVEKPSVQKEKGQQMYQHDCARELN